MVLLCWQICDFGLVWEVKCVECKCNMIFLVVIVGYMNVGKLSLLNVFISVGVFVENVLFVMFDVIVC